MNPKRTALAITAATLAGISGGLFALETTAPLEWSFPTEGAVYSPPAVGWDGTVYVGSGAKTDSETDETDLFDFYALTPGGQKKWTFPVDDWVQSSPAVGPDGTIYITSWDFFIYAVEPDGILRWLYDADGFIFSSPAVDRDGNVYFGAGDDYLYALDPDGFLRWVFQTGDWIEASPAIGPEGEVYFGSWDGYLYAVSSEGELLWEYFAGDVIFSSPAIAEDGTVYFGSGNSLFAVDSDVDADERVRWIFETGSLVDSSPAIGPDGSVYVGSADGNLHAIDPNDGEEIWSFAAGREIYSSPAVASGGTVYFGSGDNHFYAVDAGGELLWKHETGDWVDSSPVIGPDGMVYVGSFDHTLYAFSGESPPALSAWPQFAADSTRIGRQQKYFPTWLERAGGNPDESTAPHEDPAGDGVPNLLKYALGISPFTPVVAPYPEPLESTGTGLAFGFPIDRTRRDIIYAPQVSQDLETWEDIEFRTMENPEAITRGEITLSGSSPNDRFLRLRILLRDDS